MKETMFGMKENEASYVELNILTKHGRDWTPDDKELVYRYIFVQKWADTAGYILCNGSSMKINGKEVWRAPIAKDEVKDIVNTWFMRHVLNECKFDPSMKSFKSYFLAGVQILGRDSVKSLGKRKTRTFSEYEESDGETRGGGTIRNKPNNERSPQDQIEAKDIYERILTILFDSGLSEVDAYIVILDRFEDVPQDAIAARYGLTREAVAQRLRRAIEKIGPQLTKIGVSLKRPRKTGGKRDHDEK